MKAVQVDRLSLSYGESTVLSDVSFGVERGDFFVIIGPNGAGKTSLIKIIAGLLSPTSGEASVFGRPVPEYSRRELSRIVALVPQAMPSDFPFSVAETVLMGRTPYISLTGIETKKDHEIAEEAMMFTEVTQLANRRLDRLSGGELQRVVIARAICQQPDIILLDEPTASLDPAHQLKIMDLMERLRAERGTTVIMISHDLNLAAMYGDRLLLIKDGKIERTGPPEDVITEAQLAKSYGCGLKVDESPVGKVPRVTPVPEKFKII